MKYGILSIKELEELLATKDYKYIAPERHYIRDFETHNRWTSTEVLGLFDNITEENGLPPTPAQYIDRAVELTKEYWHLDSDRGLLPDYYYSDGVRQVKYIRWSENMEKAVRWRLSRMYESFMVEYSLISIVHSIYPKAKLVASSELDLVLGVDLVVIEDNKVIYVHVTKNTEWAIDSVKEKTQKRMWLRNISGKKKYWTRRFTNSHMIVLYDLEESESTKRINGHHILKVDYVKEMCEKKFEEEIDIYRGNEESEIMDFHVYLKKNFINEEGISNMLITYKFNKGK